MPMAPPLEHHFNAPATPVGEPAVNDTNLHTELKDEPPLL